MGPTKFVQMMILIDLDLLNVKVKLLPNAFIWEIFGKVDFLNTVKAKVIILT